MSVSFAEGNSLDDKARRSEASDVPAIRRKTLLQFKGEKKGGKLRGAE